MLSAVPRGLVFNARIDLHDRWRRFRVFVMLPRGLLFCEWHRVACPVTRHQYSLFGISVHKVDGEED